jgi:polyadenylation factor subunit 2
LQTFRGHKKEVATVAWHPVHEGVFASGGSDGAIMFWSVGADKEVGAIEAAHESIVWALSWHPAGHILCSGSNDHNCKFWTRNRPGDTMRDKYNLNTMPAAGPDSEDVSTADSSSNIPMIPGMAPEDRVDIPGVEGGTDFSRVPPPSLGGGELGRDRGQDRGRDRGRDRGLDYEDSRKKTPYSKPIPKSFQNSWNDVGAGPPLPQAHQQLPPQQQQQGGPVPQQQPADFGPPGPGCISLQELQRQATAVVAFGNVYPVLPGSNLFMSILSGEMAVKDVLRSEFLM